jgi:2-aminoadipate transaminase
VSLAAGLVDEATLPSGPVARAMSAILEDSETAKAALQYGSTQGLPALREAILKRILSADNTPNSTVTPADVILTTGSQQLLYLLGEVLLNPGDTVLIEAPTYFVYQGVLESAGATVVPVAMDTGGMSMAALETTLKQLEAQGKLHRVKIIYTVDYFQNPSGLSLAAERRPQLVAIAKRFSKHHRIVVLEDAAYRELRYDGPDIPSVFSHDTDHHHVVYASTFSKPLSPGLKTGYAILPHGLADAVLNLKSNHDFGSTNLAQHAIHHILKTGDFDTHIQTLCGAYVQKRDAMLAALAEYFRDWPTVTWTVPSGGLYVWLKFPNHIDTGRGGTLVDRAVQAGVLYVPGEDAYVPDEHGFIPRHEARLSFGVATPGQIREGIRRLREACRGLESVG